MGSFFLLFFKVLHEMEKKMTVGMFLFRSLVLQFYEGQWILFQSVQC